MLLEKGIAVLVRSTIAFALTAGCVSAATSTGISEVSCPPNPTLTYANFGQNLITTRCIACHDEQLPLLGTQAQVKAGSEQILSFAVYRNLMPMDSEMLLEERQMLGEWLACGAP